MQLALAERLKLFDTLFQTAHADRTVWKVRTQLFNLSFAFEAGRLQHTRIQPHYNRSFNLWIAQSIIVLP